MARICGVSRDTIRFYEREGLLPCPKRTAARHRIYDQDGVARLQFIRRAQQMGLSLDDIRIISRSRNGRLPVECGALSDCLRERLRTVEREIERLRARRRRLVKSIELCRRSKSGSCLLLRRLTASPALKRIDAAARP